MNSVEYLLQRRSVLAKNLAEFVQKGILKCRGKEKYSRYIAKYVNCLAHACFALTNAQVKEYVCRQYVDNIHCPTPFATFAGKGTSGKLDEIFEFLQQTGLKISSSNGEEILAANQCRIAIYFAKACDHPDPDKKWQSTDFHFLRQESDGSWTGKAGISRKVKRYKSLPQALPLEKENPYVLHSLYILTNPHASAILRPSFEK